MELAGIAQLAEQAPCKRQVKSSSLFISSYDLVDLDAICIMEDSASYWIYLRWRVKVVRPKVAQSAIRQATTVDIADDC